MKSCAEYEVLVSAFLDGELPAEQRSEVAAHLAACPACQRYFDDLVAIHDALDREEVPVPEGFADRVMARVRETDQDREEKVIRFPHWKRWAALAACCAVVMLGVWRFQGDKNWEASRSRSSVAQTAPSMAFDAALSAEEEAAPEAGGLIDLADSLDEEFALESETAVEEDKQVEDAIVEDCLDAPAARMSENSGADDAANGEDKDEPAAAPVAAGKQKTLAGTLTAGGPAARAWVEETLGLPWESGRTYPLTEEEYDALRTALTEAGEEFREEPGEGCCLTAE